MGSTNAEVAAAARAGAAEGLVLAADLQTLGRGRLDRKWSSPQGAGLTLSVLLRPVPPAGTWGWLPLMAGTALLGALRALSDLAISLKWPNDLLLGTGELKAAGILAESASGTVVIGIGVNVSTTDEELPQGATSLLIEGVAVSAVSRAALLIELILAIEAGYTAWAAANGDAVRCGLFAAYRNSCATLGRRVNVQLPHGASLSGTAEAVEPSGGLQVRLDDGSLNTVVAADVVHLRPEGLSRAAG